MITAHSGSDGYRDNSYEFVEAMLQSSVETFEIDCQLSAEGVLYLSHDEVQDNQQLLTLEDVFQLMNEGDNSEIRINIDCKNSRIGPMAVQLAEEYGLSDRIVLSGGLNIEDFASSFREQLFYNLDNIASYDEKMSLDELEKELQKLQQSGVVTIQSYYEWVNPEIIKLINKYQLKMSVWTVNELDLIDYYLELGCYNVTTRLALTYLNNHHNS